MESLKNVVGFPAVIYTNDQLLIVGYTGNLTTFKDIQYMNLASNTTGVYRTSIQRGDFSGFKNPGMYSVAGGNFSLFGGQKAYASCLQQIKSEHELDSPTRCLTDSESALEGLEYDGLENGNLVYDGSGTYVRYSNFVV